MFLENIIIQKIPLLLFEFAQIQPETTIDSAEEASFVFSGPQFFTALIAGVVLAFAFQLLFTNLGVAVGISLAGGSSSNDQGESNSFGGTVRKIGLAVGLGTLISVMVSLFVASFLAVKLSLFVSPALGAIIGLVIWATYFTLLVWVSSSTVGSLIGSVVNTATSGFQAVWGTAAAMVGSQAMSKQVVNTAEAAAAAVRRELGSAIDPETIKENLQDYVERLRAPELNWQGIRSDFEKLLNTSEFDQVVASGDVPNLDRQTFATLISDRTDLSKRDAEKLAAQLEDAWKQKVGQHKPKNTITSLVDYLKSAAPEELIGGQLGDKIDSIIAQMGKGKGNQSQQPGAVSQALTLSLNSLMGLVLGRSDLSEFDAEKVITQLQKLKGFAGEQKDKLVAQVNQKDNYSPIRADLENYLLNAYSWQLKPATLKQEVQDLIYDSDANPEMMAAELEGLNRGDFVNWLQQKGLLTHDEIESKANILENIRLDTMAATQAAIERAKTITLLAEVEHYLLNTPAAELVPEKIQLNFKPILEDSSTDSDRLIKRLSQLDHLTYKDILEMRADLAAEDIAIIIPYLESVQQQVIKESQDATEAAKAKIDQQWLKVQSYLKDTHKEELNPDAIKREIQLLLDDPQAGAHALGARVSRFDRDTLVQLLTQREDLSEEQVNQTIDQIENTWKSVRYAPQQLAGKAKEQYDQSVSSILDYLRSTGKEELNPEGIQRDLKKLLDDPSEGAKSIRSRLARMDRDTLVKLLSQREDLSEEQVNHIIDNVQGTLQDLANAPRRLARRTQQKVQDFQGTIADYLRSTDKEEFNPEGIKRDVQLLLNDPRAGVESLQERLSKIDRESLIALLSQREDISEEDAKRIVDQILVVRERTIEQLQSIQKQLQSAVDSLLNRIRDYLNSLERPELNYDGIKTDLRTMLDDPQAGFDALRDRFSQLDRDTLIAVISSRDDISQADAERLVNQVEGTRDRMLQRAERLQRETQYRLEKVKEDAQKQIEETRKAAATASWWLFFTALFSALASAGAGALGVIS